MGNESRSVKQVSEIAILLLVGSPAAPFPASMFIDGAAPFGKESIMSITVSPTSASITIGSQIQLTPSASAKWESDNPAIATVNQSGLVQAGAGDAANPYYVTGGIAVISATQSRADGSPAGAPATCKITVLGTGTRPFTQQINQPNWLNTL